ncbi:Elongation factor Ts, mitochondrial [Melia azedarach]|uniref:Elongation factor Ts, mitochondrial n=2 Tax=Melia azedarach TaxID=155640 RepID=A0ACC1Y2J3_MELAZ|nr:Elongation factor Ts, mitochondrial [Melia azedarach]KAJ4717362.1 Elongation factor Ts, mitochondrial [Melia azedarach]
MAFSRNAKHPLRMFLYNRVTAATNHKSGYSTWASKGTPISGTTQIKDLFSSKHGNPKSTIALISRHFSDQAPVATEQMNLIKQLRERTSAPIKDVKTALVDCNWDIEAAQKELRKRGKVLASKKSSRTATEGLLALAQTESKVAVIELNCETDFVARNEVFQYLALSLAKQALLVENISQQASGVCPVGPEHLEGLQLNLEHPKVSGATTVQNAITEVAAMMGENVKLRRGFVMTTSSPGVVSTYLHTSPQPGLGRIAGLLSLEVEEKNSILDPLQRVGSELAMHVVAAKPLFLTKELVSSAALENEREILKSQAESTGKSQMAVEKMVEGRLRKYYEEVVLMEQKFIMNDSLNVKTLLNNLSKEVGSPVKIGSFFRMEVGEGIQRAEASGADEPVAQAA